jgi:SpoVK/Ycf46/Vps4 family AAA+-type ATPase
MSTAEQIIALVKSHVEGDERRFLSVVSQVAAREARQGHVNVAQELKRLIDVARDQAPHFGKAPAPLSLGFPAPQPKGELAGLLSVATPSERLSHMVLPEGVEQRLRRVLLEQKQQTLLREHNLLPRRKVLLVGPPGSGKTMTAHVLAGELDVPLMTILLEGVITKYMGETASKLRLIFEAMATTRGVYFFDEFDAIGARRSAGNDVGEIRRVLNSFLQLLEQDTSHSLVIAATNHPDLLDPALFRRFDDVIAYDLPDEVVISRILKTRLAPFTTKSVKWPQAVKAAAGLSHAEVSRAADEAAKVAVLSGHLEIETAALVTALQERRTGQS